MAPLSVKVNNRKRRELEVLASSLASFCTGISDQFRCPVCLIDTPLVDDRKITDAHIIPQAAGGTLSTYLCQSCNSLFGSRQDKWFGEYVRLRTNPEASVLDFKEKPNEMIFGTTRIGGELIDGPNNSFEFYIDLRRTSPKEQASLCEEVRKYRESGESSMTLRVPMLAKSREIDIGFLTAAYLLWFLEFGYSFVLQRHLDPVRRQLLNVDQNTVPERFCWILPSVFSQPVAGFALCKGRPLMIAGICDHVVVLPAFGNPTTLADLSEIQGEFTLERTTGFSFRKLIDVAMPTSVVVGDDLLIVPDVMNTEKGVGQMAIFDSCERFSRVVRPSN